MAKDVRFGIRPGKPEAPRSSAEALDAWVADKPQEDKAKTTETFRMTVDIPIEMHIRLKNEATSRRIKLRELLIEILDEHWKKSE